MKVLIELPTWLGDSVMATPAIESVVKHLRGVEITLIGSFVAIEVLKHHPNVIKSYILDKSYYNLFKVLKDLEEFDVFLSFRNTLRAKIIKFFTSSKSKFQFDKNIYYKGHQVEKYNNFVNDSLKINAIASHLKLYINNENSAKKNRLLGLNPGAMYGSSKRWHPKNFADVATELSIKYDIIIFGGPGEEDIAKDIEKYLKDNGISNYQNLAGKLAIKELVSQIASLDLFISGDSGPMHIAAALQIPTVAIFGPTMDNVTSQWMNHNSSIVKKNLECQPCMKRVCPLKHHKCMKLVKASEVLEATKFLN